jgi:hypothetical protein
VAAGRAFGLQLKAAPIADEAFQVWPENWQAVEVFCALSTQWRSVALSSMATARVMMTGIEYSAIEPVCRLMGIRKRDRATLFQRLRVMESAALEVTYEAD